MSRNDQTFHTYMTCFQNESMYVQNTHVLCDACIVCLFICMSSMYVQLFTAFEVAVLKLYVPW